MNTPQDLDRRCPPNGALGEAAPLDTNVIYCGDNLEVLQKYIPDESVDLIYIDPPFNSNRNYEVFWGEAQERRAFEDRFGDAMSYLDWMRPRIRELYRVLKPTGSFYYHCDWHASHYIKVELDRIFGFNNFQNEILWYYYNKMHDRRKKLFPRAHDSLLSYVKDAQSRFTFHQLKERREKPVRQLNRQKVNGRMVNVKDAAGHVTYTIREDRIIDDVWRLPALQPASRERLGYPTQKPLSLLERVISASSDEGQMVLDAFCGCGTTLEAAVRLRRRWIGIDFSPTACRVMAQRLERIGLEEDEDFTLRDMPKNISQLRQMPHFEFQNWAVIALGGIPNKVKSGDYGIDGRLYVADIAPKERHSMKDLFGEIDNWYPIQVKQKDKAGRPDIDSFETAMMRDRRLRGYFIAFDFSRDAYTEIKRANRDAGLDIVPVTVSDILKHERVAVGV